ncbi:unnamed protein product [Lactuca virosa]|uniref:SAC domain-containing protein n=1 Tax=Lactuca virosa TaxID=75947 RepID=A0AAU9ND44_9ASTR|nr:unnamed protein product [Lactuca virosa]
MREVVVVMVFLVVVAMTVSVTEIQRMATAHVGHMNAIAGQGVGWNWNSIPFQLANENEFKREGAGRGNWGTHADEITQETEEVVVEGEKNVGSDKPLAEEEATNEKKENAANELEDKDEDKEMTLEEYQKVLEEKRKALEAPKQTQQIFLQTTKGELVAEYKGIIQSNCIDCLDRTNVTQNIVLY